MCAMNVNDEERGNPLSGTNHELITTPIGTISHEVHTFYQFISSVIHHVPRCMLNMFLGFPPLSIYCIQKYTCSHEGFLPVV